MKRGIIFSSKRSSFLFRIILILLFLVLCFALALAARRQDGSGNVIDQDIACMAGACHSLDSNTYALLSTVGQPCIGISQNKPGYQLFHGIDLTEYSDIPVESTGYLMY